MTNATAGRIANRLDLSGASYVVDAASASSLVALDLAMRALIGMFVTFAANLVGHGLAPPLIGAASDLFGAHFGNSVDGLRWALISASVFYPWAAVHFVLASRTVAQDLET